MNGPSACSIDSACNLIIDLKDFLSFFKWHQQQRVQTLSSSADMLEYE